MNLKNLVIQLTKEAQAYENQDQLKSMMESEMGIKNVPIQPLYQALRSLNPQERSEILPSLSKAQRTVLYDIDLWQKDDLDVNNFQEWLAAVAHIEDEAVKIEFLMSSEFTLFLKGRFHISTFDTEDPEYPEHEDFFLTDDTLLLFEYDAEFPYVNELQSLIRLLYSVIGVEEAYAYLFKITVDSYLEMQETEFRNKKERLRDLGFVDYFDALEFISSFPSKSHIDYFIKNKKPLTSGLSAQSKNQTLNANAIRPYETGLEFLEEEIQKVSDDKRVDFLKFNFLRMVNATMTLDDALKSGKIAMNRVAKKSLFVLHLGFSYMYENYQANEEHCFFDAFDFSEIYRVGHGLLAVEKTKLKKALMQNQFGDEDKDKFLGNFWNVYLDNSMNEMPTVQGRWGETQLDLKIDNINDHRLWESLNSTFIESLPFIKSFNETWKKVLDGGQVFSHLYINYDIEQIDFEAILLSSFSNFVLGHLDGNSKKLGISVGEFNELYKKYFDEKGSLNRNRELLDDIGKFVDQFGFSTVNNFQNFVYAVCLDNLEGYELEGLSADEYQHIGGPIIFNAN